MLQKITLISDDIFKIKDDNSEEIYFSANQEGIMEKDKDLLVVVLLQHLCLSIITTISIQL